MSLKQKVFVNVFWSVAGQLGINLIQLIANIVFARFLTPTEFGQLGIVMFFVLISNVMIEGGLGGALVRKIDATDIDISTVFIFNFIISLVLYILLLLSSNGIAIYYDDPQLKVIIVVVGSILVINSLIFIQDTRLVKGLHFKKIANYKLISTLIANVCGIILVCRNFGIWALIITIILNPLILVTILWIKEGGIGKIRFSYNSFRKLYSFGINTSLASLIDTLFNNIYQLILGKFFSISISGLYYQAKKLQDVPNSIIFATSNSVIFSSLAQLQKDPPRFASTYNKIQNYFSVLIGVITMMILLYSNEIVQLLFGSKWIGSVWYLRIISIASFFYVHEILNRVIFKVFDRTELILRLEIVKKILLSVSIFIGILMLNIDVLLIGFTVVSGISYIFNYLLSRRISGSDSWSELKNFLKISASLTITIFIYFILKIKLNLIDYYAFVLIPVVLTIYIMFLRIQGIKLGLTQFKELHALIKK